MGSTIERRHAYVLAHPKLLAKHKKAILNGQVKLGMSREEVIASLGPPTVAVDTNAFWAEREQWVYESHDKAEFYYFKFGQLHSWHTTPKVNKPAVVPASQSNQPFPPLAETYINTGFQVHSK
ncbi:hypothetical protein MNBD_GAMMA16-2180 [hydrothermal vent metagenome]|uniref:Lipoprotein SmpA/OmlA domain-containing protein n=1 Tax=hydrothermal vent metagenome TaxID=652676 RepID=A0A3B1A3K8_9ZZZZ